MMRTEMTAEGTTIISIYNSDEETAYAYYPDMGMVMVITYQPQDPLPMRRGSYEL